MCPRHQRPRKVSNPPLISGMKPYGSNIQGKSIPVVFLQYEEYEAIRLCDHEGLNHLEASKKMMVSRPTLTRIYANARKKMAEAIIEGKQMIIEGGKVYFDSSWHECTACGCYFNHMNHQKEPLQCTLCGSLKTQACQTDPEEENPNDRCNK